jgi:aldehyde:ferredoxin oxidoreductase
MKPFTVTLEDRRVVEVTVLAETADIAKQVATERYNFGELVTVDLDGEITAVEVTEPRMETCRYCSARCRRQRGRDMGRPERYRRRFRMA